MNLAWAMLDTAAPTRSWARFSIMWWNPRSSSPMRFSSGTRTSVKNSSAVSASGWPTLSSTRPGSNPGMPFSTPKRLMPRAPASGVVRAATMTRSAVEPLVMKVLDPLMTKSPPSRFAVVFRLARSDPPEGSVMPMAVMISPLQKPGSHRSFCSSVVSSTRYGAQMSAWIPNADDVAADGRDSSSPSTALKR